MGQIREIKPEELKLTEVFRALGDTKRFLIFKNLINSPCYADELSELLGISRPALGKHMRMLIDAGLAHLKYTVENGKTKARLEPTEVSSEIGGIIDELVSGVAKEEANREKRLRSELAEAEIQHDSIKATLERLEKRRKERTISNEEYLRLRGVYEGQLRRLAGRLAQLQRMVRA